MEAIEKVGGDMELLKGPETKAMKRMREKEGVKVARVLKRMRMVRG